MKRLVLLVLLAFGVVVVGCGSDDAEPPSAGDEGESTSVVESGDSLPYGLDSVDLPESDAEVSAVFDAMPPELEGLSRAEDVGAVARYGGELNTLAAGLAADFDAETVLGDLSAFEDEPGAEVEASDLEAEAGVVWLFGSFEDEGGAGTVFVASWGEPDGEWIFSVNAETPELRAALVRAFIEST